MGQPVRAVLFDFAGTLFAPRRAVDQVAGCARRLGLDIAPDDAAALAERYLTAGLPGAPYPSAVPDALAAVYAERDLRPAAHREAYVGLLATVAGPHPAFAEALYEEVHLPDGWVPYADAREVVDALTRDGIRVGVISNVGFDLRLILRHHGFAAAAERATLSYEVGAIKPSPEIFGAALRTLEADASETLMVGDHAVADGGGVALGIRTLLLPMSPPGTRHGLDSVLALVA